MSTSFHTLAQSSSSHWIIQSNFGLKQRVKSQWTEASWMDSLRIFFSWMIWSPVSVSFWENWKWKKQCAFKLQEQRCCDRREGPLCLILKIFWQSAGFGRWSKASLCYLWHFTTPLISAAQRLKSFHVRTRGRGPDGWWFICASSIVSYIYLWITSVYLHLHTHFV